MGKTIPIPHPLNADIPYLLEDPPARATPIFPQRPFVRGKYLYANERKLWVRGVTYGTFRPDGTGNGFPDPTVAQSDFRNMAANGLNALRTYTVPPPWLLDLAANHGLYVMVGLPWEQHVDFLSDRKLARSIEQRVRAGVKQCAGHPAVLCFAIGNEIPSPIVRWLGPDQVERYLERLFQVAKEEQPNSLVTYINYPSTEYLRLPFLDLLAFNVYLETHDTLNRYLLRLQNLAGDRPLLMSELGLDSMRHGDTVQAHTLDWQIRTAFAAGCAGAFIFSWTDEWHRGGYDIEDWKFGLVTRDRQTKPALAAVRKAFADAPFRKTLHRPRISVVVCTYNGSRTIRECLNALQKIHYPDFEVIVVDDGSTDATPTILSEYDVSVIRTENKGLSNARNVGAWAATGEIVAFTDDDAVPDPHWLEYLAGVFCTTNHAAVGGPNIPPPDECLVAKSVALSPGNPMHVLLSDTDAEHIPGCNLSIRKTALLEIGGFDPQFRIAGDDLDVCWRLHQRGWTLGFSPGAVVWHRRRSTISAYWRQQLNYGKAEALLEAKWPEKYNPLGHLRWLGHIYGHEFRFRFRLGRGSTIYHGTWGSAPFQTLYNPTPNVIEALLSLPEWHLLNLALLVLGFLGILWAPLYYSFLVLLFTAFLPLAQMVIRVSRLHSPGIPKSFRKSWKLKSLTILLNMIQPLARLRGRFSRGLTPWRWHGRNAIAFPNPGLFTLWSEHWRSPEAWLQALEDELRRQGAVPARGGHFDRWDLEVRAGLFGAARVQMVAEEHGSGKQLVRFRLLPKYSRALGLLNFAILFLTIVAAAQRQAVASVTLVSIGLLLTQRVCLECGRAKAWILSAIEQLRSQES